MGESLSVPCLSFVDQGLSGRQHLVNIIGEAWATLMVFSEACRSMPVWASEGRAVGLFVMLLRIAYSLSVFRLLSNELCLEVASGTIGCGGKAYGVAKMALVYSGVGFLVV